MAEISYSYISQVILDAMPAGVGCCLRPRGKGQLAQNLATTNLNLRSMEADTQNKLALIRGDVEGKLALKRFEAGLAGATHCALA